ncbi:Yippee/Mis18, partial [Rhizopus microsporus]
DTVNVYYSCVICHSQLVSHQDVISKAFQGRYGAAYLVENMINIMTGKDEDRQLMTGIHTVADISCRICQTKIGWKYIKTPKESERYKLGKCVVEKSRVIK